jgi:hypothetical protein
VDEMFPEWDTKSAEYGTLVIQLFTRSSNTAWSMGEAKKVIKEKEIKDMESLDHAKIHARIDKTLVDRNTRKLVKPIGKFV